RGRAEPAAAAASRGGPLRRCAAAFGSAAADSEAADAEAADAAAAAALRRLATRVLADEALARELARKPGVLEVLGGAGALAESPEGDGAGLSADDDVPLPSMTQLRLYATTHFIPFVGFGFLDIGARWRILAGDYIDFKLGCTLGISTMAAAAIGNTVSDVAGIWGSGFIEHVAALIGLPGRVAATSVCCLRPSPSEA
ncbi:unnamed protein product, partial [Prorocentrum cordatum]